MSLRNVSTNYLHFEQFLRYAIVGLKQVSTDLRVFVLFQSTLSSLLLWSLRVPTKRYFALLMFIWWIGYNLPYGNNAYTQGLLFLFNLIVVLRLSGLARLTLTVPLFAVHSSMIFFLTSYILGWFRLNFRTALIVIISGVILMRLSDMRAFVGGLYDFDFYFNVFPDAENQTQLAIKVTFSILILWLADRVDMDTFFISSYSYLVLAYILLSFNAEIASRVYVLARSLELVMFGKIIYGVSRYFIPRTCYLLILSTLYHINFITLLINEDFKYSTWLQ
jgi:hypothetical protein